MLLVGFIIVRNDDDVGTLQVSGMLKAIAGTAGITRGNHPETMKTVIRWRWLQELQVAGSGYGAELAARSKSNRRCRQNGDGGNLSARNALGHGGADATRLCVSCCMRHVVAV